MRGLPSRRLRRVVLTTTAVATFLLTGGAEAGEERGRHGRSQDASAQGADEGDNRHPSGKDRSVEPGGSGTQGKSGSDPDGADNGGADKPGGPGGLDREDQDGNNGCGNDDDFEDDNNGNCGGPGSAPAGVTSELTPELPPDVLGEKLTKPGVTPEVLGTKFVRRTTERPAEVLGVRITRNLPFTGAPLGDLAATASGLLLAGTTTLVVARRRRSG